MSAVRFAPHVPHTTHGNSVPTSVSPAQAAGQIEATSRTRGIARSTLAAWTWPLFFLLGALSLNAATWLTTQQTQARIKSMQTRQARAMEQQAAVEHDYYTLMNQRNLRSAAARHQAQLLPAQDPVEVLAQPRLAAWRGQ